MASICNFRAACRECKRRNMEKVWLRGPLQSHRYANKNKQLLCQYLHCRRIISSNSDRYLHVGRCQTPYAIRHPHPSTHRHRQTPRHANLIDLALINDRAEAVISNNVYYQMSRRRQWAMGFVFAVKKLFISTRKMIAVTDRPTLSRSIISSLAPQC